MDDTNDPPESLAPTRPAVEYEDIHIRELNIGFSGGEQQMTLYPEDIFEADEAGNIRVKFSTVGDDAEFVAYAGHTQWHRIRSVPHRRIKGTLRPTPEQVREEILRQQQESLTKGIGPNQAYRPSRGIS